MYRSLLVLPALYSEFENPAMRRIADALADVPYIRQIVVALGRAGIDEYRKVQEFFADFPQKITILWVDQSRRFRIFWESSRSEACPPAPTERGDPAGLPMAIFSQRATVT